MTHDPLPADLVALEAEIARCRICRDAPRGAPLPHEPRPVTRASATARILVAGQAPGTRVHASGLPFTDPSGDRLRAWMGVDEAVFYDRARIAIVPMGFCYPGTAPKGGDYPPRPECAPRWHAEVMAALPAVELTLLVGSYAQAHYLGDRRKPTMTETVAAWREYGPRSIPLPHPSWRNTAWIKRNPWFEDDLVPALRERVHDLFG